MNIAVKNILGLPDKKRTFSVSPKPGKQAVCNLEGKNIIKSVNLQYLRNLVDLENDTKLNIKWGLWDSIREGHEIKSNEPATAEVEIYRGL
ncbi:hypothetical protein F4823DRAFT_604771 [Ustulina deusta]|nr:hypothetical protein F4823DRAFT_604771 [Ustulina deusta]